MKYGIRVAVGIAFGALLSVGLTLLTGKWWTGALAGGLLGPVAFLGTFFIWSADRLDEGYEQVLFDRPNTVLSGVMLVAFVGVAFAAGLVAPAGGLSPEERAALAELDESHADLAKLASEASAVEQAISKGEAPKPVRLTDARVARGEVSALGAPGAAAPLKSTLLTAATTLEKSLEALVKCAGGDNAACLDARNGHAETTRALKAYEEARAAL